MKPNVVLCLLSFYIFINLEAFDAQSLTGIPCFNETYEGVFLTEGKEGQILCSVSTGEGPITYRWFNESNYEILSDWKDNIRTWKIPDGKVLIIKSPKEANNGVYTCTAENIHGLESKIYEVFVITGNNSDNNTAGGEVSIDQVKTENVTNKSVLFFVQTTGPVEFISVRYFEKLSKNITRTSKFQKDEPIEITNLLGSGLYSFQFQASNANGSSEWTETYNVTLFPDAPEVTIRRLNDGYLQIEWERYFSAWGRDTIDKHLLTYNPARRINPDTFKEDDSGISIEIRSRTSYAITDLSKNVYYVIRLRAHTEAGYGEPYKFRLFFPNQ